MPTKRLPRYCPFCGEPARNSRSTYCSPQHRWQAWYWRHNTPKERAKKAERNRQWRQRAKLEAHRAETSFTRTARSGRA